MSVKFYNTLNTVREHPNQFLVFWQLLKSEYVDASFVKIRGSVGTKIAKYALMLFFAGLLFYVYNYMLPAFSVLGASPYIALVPAIFIFYTLITSFQSMQGMAKSLFQNPKNDILFAFPITNITIFLSKIVARYLIELVKTLVFFLPFLLSIYYNNAGVEYGALVPFLGRISVICFTIPAIALFLGTIFAVVYFYAFSFLKRSRIATLVVSLLAVSLIFTLVIIFIDNMRGQDRYIRFDTFQTRWQNVNFAFQRNFLNNLFFFKYLYYLIFKVDVSIAAVDIIRRPTAVHLTVIFGTVFVLFLVSSLVSYFVYFKLANRIKMNLANKEKRFNIFEKSGNTPTKAFTIKELIQLFRNSDTIAKYIFYIATLPLISIILNKTYSAFQLNSFGFKMVVILNVLVGLIVLTTSNTIASSIISREGGKLYILKTIPGNTYKLISAKVAINIAINFLIVALNLIIMLIYPSTEKKVAVLIAAIFLVFNIVHILYSASVDLTQSEYQKFEETADVSKLKNVGFSSVVGIVMSLVVVILLVAFGATAKALSLLLVFGVVALAFSVFTFHLKIKVYFDVMCG